MKRLIISCLLFVLFNCPCFARDYIVELVEESYQEAQHWSKLSYSPFVYHSIHIKFKNNSKLLVLTGKDHIYRQWLRQYIAKNRYFVITIPKDEDNFFVSSQVYKIDVTSVHAIDMSLIKDRESFGLKHRLDQNRLGLKNLKKAQKDKEKVKEDALSEDTATKEAEQKRLEQEKKRKAEAEEKAAKDKKQKDEAEKQRLEREKELRAKAEQEAADEQKQRETAEKEWLEREKKLLAEAVREAAEERKRREKAEKRWLAREKELRARLEKEALEEQRRRKKADKRWLRRKKWLNAGRFYGSD